MFQSDSNKAKGRVSKRVFQENKARQIFRKTIISYPLIRTHTCAYQGVNVRFPENSVCFVFLKHPFWDSPFRLTTGENFSLTFRLFLALCVTFSKKILCEYNTLEHTEWANKPLGLVFTWKYFQVSQNYNCCYIENFHVMKHFRNIARELTF